MAQNGQQEKERTRTDAERIVGLHIKTSALSMAYVVTETQAA